jgi:hypothetical protein
MLRQAIEALAEDTAQLEAQQDLSPERQHSGFVERGFDQLRQSHRNSQFPRGGLQPSQRFGCVSNSVGYRAIGHTGT